MIGARRVKALLLGTGTIALVLAARTPARAQLSGASDTDFTGVAPDSHRAGPRQLEAHERAAVDRAAENVELVPAP